MTSPTWKYDVALSYAGEDREVARELATRLQAAGYLVFYDGFEELWGQDLSVKLHQIYGEQSRYGVPLVSQHYVKKPWTNHERQVLLARAMKQQAVYLLPIRLDNSALPGLADVVAYKDLRQTSLDEIISSLQQLLGPPRQAPKKGRSISSGATWLSAFSRATSSESSCNRTTSRHLGSISIARSSTRVGRTRTSSGSRRM